MLTDSTLKKFEILADAAKYDSCGTCGTSSSTSQSFKKWQKFSPLGGIYQSISSEGKCLSLFKVLYTNFCENNCLYCVNRSSNDLPRATFKPQELINLFLYFLKKKYVSGLFLSSGIIKNADFTMERMIKVVQDLRFKYKFKGYIHLKIIPGASSELIKQAISLANRVSVNLECPNEKHLKKVCPGKDFRKDLVASMQTVTTHLKNNKDKFSSPHSFSPTQTTQLIVGATQETDKEILNSVDILYQKLNLKRVYYSAFVNKSADSSLSQIEEIPIEREHRLYQTDWLLRFYGFNAKEIPLTKSGNLSLEIDPKMSWVLKNLHYFPVEINKASKWLLLRTPGIGPASVKKIINYRRSFPILHPQTLKTLNLNLKRVVSFITLNGKYFGGSAGKKILSTGISSSFSKSTQLSIF